MQRSSRLIVPVVGALILAACGGGSDEAADSSPAESAVETTPVTDPPATDPPATDPPATDPPATDPPATDPPATDPPVDDDEGDDDEFPDAQSIVETLADDEFNGRNNQTEESTAVRDLLVQAVEMISDPVGPDGNYLQEYDLGTNIVGIIPGSGDLADEYVMVGAHYDHLAPGECDTLGEPDDVICNGAADNAAGVAAVLTIAADFASTPPPEDGERSMIVALWDGEEDGLVGAFAYVADPLIPLEQTVAYVNFDIQGVSLLPSMSNGTILVGPETGGPQLVEAAAMATSASPLDYATLSLIFGQGRSDHAALVSGGVASVFFTDANNGCYHTVLDDVDHVDFDKLTKQIATADALVDELMVTLTPPEFVADTPLSTYADAEQLLALVRLGEPDLALLPDGGAAATQFLVDLQAIVDAGPEAYDDAAGGVLLGGAAALVDALANSECMAPA